MRLSQLVRLAQVQFKLQKLDSSVSLRGKQYTYVWETRHQGILLTPEQPVYGTGYTADTTEPLTHLIHLEGKDEVTDDYMQTAPSKLHFKRVATQGKATLYQLSKPVRSHHDLTVLEDSFDTLPSETLEQEEQEHEQKRQKEKEKEQQRKEEKEHELEEVRKLPSGAAVLFTPPTGIGGFTWTRQAPPLGIFVKLKSPNTAWVWLRPPGKGKSGLYPVRLEDLSVGPKDKANPKLAAQLIERFKLG